MPSSLSLHCTISAPSFKALCNIKVVGKQELQRGSWAPSQRFPRLCLYQRPQQAAGRPLIFLPTGTAMLAPTWTNPLLLKKTGWPDPSCPLRAALQAPAKSSPREDACGDGADISWLGFEPGCGPVSTLGWVAEGSPGVAGWIDSLTSGAAPGESLQRSRSSSTAGRRWGIDVLRGSLRDCLRQRIRYLPRGQKLEGKHAP